ncbi:unnamed protein product [Sphenostylis stenocarpa]|uniref:Uncharacterized protein n=1 Tax=Sphenostylis stenocarpa TaxID=92480 RepID=A0AA86W3V0_9FABA|nr:unnamed protein product [Sphenostylis stenocarpa]
MISQGQAHKHLTYLTIEECPQFESLPEHMHILSSLFYLWIHNCPKLELFPKGGLPSSLTEMNLNNCPKLVTTLKGALGANSSLKTLSIGKLDTMCFPDQGLLPHHLNSLQIYNCPNLQKLDYNGLSHLPSLKELVLKDCPSLQCLPEEGLPKSISDFKISGKCSKLRQHCQLPNGDWGKIAHIENLNFE